MDEEIPQLLSVLTKSWPFLLTFVAIIFSWAKLQNTDAQQAKDIKDLRERLDESEKGNNKIEVTLAQIQTDILWIKERLSEK